MTLLNNLGAVSNLGGTLANAGGWGDTGSSLGGVGGLLGLAGGIENQNPFQAGLGAFGAYGGLSHLFPDTVPSIGSLFGGAGGEAAAGGLAGLGTGALAGLVAAPATIALGDWVAEMFGSGPHVTNKQSAMAHDTQNIRQAFQTAYPQMQQGAQAFGSLPGIAGLPSAQQIPMLQQALSTANAGVGAFPSVDQYIATQGGRHSNFHGFSVPPVDVSGVNNQFWPMLGGSDLAGLAAADRLAALGTDPGTVAGGGGYSPIEQLNWLRFLDPAVTGTVQTGLAPAGKGGADWSPLPFTPEDLAMGSQTGYYGNGLASIEVPQATLDAMGTPGNRLAGMQSFFSGLDPNFSSSQLGQMFSTLGPYMNQTVDPAMQATIQARQQQETADAALARQRAADDAYAMSQTPNFGGGG